MVHKNLLLTSIHSGQSEPTSSSNPDLKSEAADHLPLTAISHVRSTDSVCRLDIIHTNCPGRRRSPLCLFSGDRVPDRGPKTSIVLEIQVEMEGRREHNKSSSMSVDQFVSIMTPLIDLERVRSPTISSLSSSVMWEFGSFFLRWIWGLRVFRALKFNDLGRVANECLCELLGCQECNFVPGMVCGTA